jgi:3'5'-cyclic nucleotide phosphodiesterase
MVDFDEHAYDRAVVSSIQDVGEPAAVAKVMARHVRAGPKGLLERPRSLNTYVHRDVAASSPGTPPGTQMTYSSSQPSSPGPLLRNTNTSISARPAPLQIGNSNLARGAHSHSRSDSHSDSHSHSPSPAHSPIAHHSPRFMYRQGQLRHGFTTTAASSATSAMPSTIDGINQTTRSASLSVPSSARDMFYVHRRGSAPNSSNSIVSIQSERTDVSGSDDTTSQYSAAECINASMLSLNDEPAVISTDGVHLVQAANSSEDCATLPPHPIHPMHSAQSLSKVSDHGHGAESRTSVLVRGFESPALESRYIRGRFHSERIRLLGLWVALFLGIGLIFLTELHLDSSLRARSDSSIAATRGVALCAIVLAAIHSWVANIEHGSELHMAISLSILGVTVAANQVCVETETENLLSLIGVLTFLGLTIPLCQLTAVFTSAFSVVTMLAYVLCMFLNAMLFDTAQTNGWTAAMQIIVTLGTVFVPLVGRIAQETRERDHFQKADNFQQQARELRSEVIRLSSEQQYVAVPHPSIDFASPLEKAQEFLLHLAHNPKLSELESQDLMSVVALLGDTSIYMPSLAVTDDEVSPIDTETRSWLNQLLMSQHAKPTPHTPENSPKSRQGRPRSKSQVVRPSSTGGIIKMRHVHTMSGHNLTSLIKENEVRVSEMLDCIDTWNFDPFKLSELSESRPLFAVGITLFQRHDLINKCNMDAKQVSTFLSTIERGYFQNLYHNNTHAADVTQTMYHLINIGRDDCLVNTLSPTELLAVIISGLVHDYEHPGLTNAFLVNARDPLAVVYNDRAVLENHHAASTFRVLNRPDCAILSNLSRDEQKQVRSWIISLVLATDLAQHFEIISQIKSKLAAGPLDSECEDDRQLALKLVIKAADLSHTAKSRELHLKWTDRIQNEFFRQGDLERKRGSPVSAFMDRHTTNIAQSQVGFINFLVVPMYESLEVLLPYPSFRQVIMSQLRENLNYWKTRLEASEKEHGADSGTGTGADSDSKSNVDRNKDSDISDSNSTMVQRQSDDRHHRQQQQQQQQQQPHQDDNEDVESSDQQLLDTGSNTNAQ